MELYKLTQLKCQLAFFFVGFSQSPWPNLVDSRWIRNNTTASWTVTINLSDE